VDLGRVSLESVRSGGLPGMEQRPMGSRDHPGGSDFHSYCCVGGVVGGWWGWGVGVGCWGQDSWNLAARTGLTEGGGKEGELCEEKWG